MGLGRKHQFFVGNHWLIEVQQEMDDGLRQISCSP